MSFNLFVKDQTLIILFYIYEWVNTDHDSQWYPFVVSNTHQLHFINTYTTFAVQNFHGWSWNWTAPLITSNSLFYLHEVFEGYGLVLLSPWLALLFVTILSWFSKVWERVRLWYYSFLIVPAHLLGFRTTSVLVHPLAEEYSRCFLPHHLTLAH